MIEKKILILLILIVAGSLSGFYYLNTDHGVHQILKNDLSMSKSNKFMPSKLSSSIFEEALQELCPFPGFHGNFCPGEMSSERYFSTNSLPHMPSGIGASFDITTGNLKLPSIELTYQNQDYIWTDPHSNIQFVVAEETNVEQVELPADTKIFKNEFDLANVWLDALNRGQWLGGQYSSAKDLNDLYERLFKGQQETAISQLAKDVIRLSFKSDNLKLNRFAQRAINSLPQDFNEGIYNEFLESWGTHIAVDTYIGGMIEKQNVFKECVYSSPAFTGGLSPDQIVQALNNELHGIQGEGFFVARRRVSIDHKFGGNPEDVSNWEQSISQNPALLKINRFVSWADLASDSQIKDNLQRAIWNRVESMKQRYASYSYQVQEQRRQQRNAPKYAYGFFGIKFFFMDQAPFQMSSAAECPVGLSFEETRNKCRNKNFDDLGPLCEYQSVRYERDDYGRFRTLYNNRFASYELDGNEYYGEWVENGCSIAQHPNFPSYSDISQPIPLESLVRIICVGCNPEITNGQGGDVFQCACPAF